MRRAAWLLTLAVLGSSATACTTNDGEQTKAAGPMGGTLRVAITEPGALDPADAYEPAGLLVDSLLCEPLLTIDPQTGRLRPGLATTWIVSDGGRRITLRLRKARFSNGQRVTSDDVIASLSRAATEEFAGHAANLLEPIAGWEWTSGRKETENDRDRRVIRGLSAIDGSSLTIVLSKPNADFLRVLAQPVAAPVPRRLTERDPDALAAQPVCAGPYKLARPWHPGDPSITLVRNEHYHGRNPAFTNGGRGYADVVEFAVGAPADKVDIAAVPFADWPAVAEADRAERLSGYIDYVGVPLADPDLRLALSLALDRQSISPARRPGRGFLPPAAGPAGREDGCGDRAPARADLARARAVAQDKLTSATPLVLAFNDELGNRSIMESVARQWHDAFGLDVQLQPTPFDALVRQAADPAGIKTAFRMGWQPPVPGPEAYVGPLFTSAGIGTDNLARFADPAVDRRLDREARNAADEKDRDLAYRSVEQMLCQAMPLIPVAAGVSRWAVRAGTAGSTTLDRARGWPVLRELYVRQGGNS
jgi:ABC-type oligopeptide transport system substrate-binding subunit